MLSKIKNFIFDLDGTIINSSDEVLRCLDLAFKNANYLIDKSRLTPDVIGPPLKEIVQNIAPEICDEKLIENIIAQFRNIYDTDKNDVSFIYSGMYNFLLNLKSQNKKLFIATFKPTTPTKRIIEQFKLNMFDDFYTIDKFDYNMTKAEMIADIISRYKLNKEETIMIGDAPSDIIAALDNNVKGIGVMWGYGQNKEELKKHSFKTVENVEELECLKLS